MGPVTCLWGQEVLDCGEEEGISTLRLAKIPWILKGGGFCKSTGQLVNLVE